MKSSKNAVQTLLDQNDELSANPIFHDPYHGIGVAADFLSGVFGDCIHTAYY